MFLKNYYIFPFIVESLLLGAVVLFKDYLLVREDIYYGIVIGISLITLKTLYRLILRRRGVTSLAFSKALYYSLENSKPDIKNVFIGKGYVWENKHVQALYELSRVKSLKKYFDTRKTAGNPSIHGVGIEDEISITLPTSSLSLHTAIIGGTGSGKTRLLESLATQAVMRGEPVIVIDPKGDGDLVNRLYDTCKRYGREDDWQFFSLSHPKHSQTYNPLESYTKPSDIATRVISLIDSTGDKFYADFAWNLVHSVTKGLISLNRAVTLKTISRYALNDLHDLYKDLIEFKNSLNEDNNYLKPSVEESIEGIKTILSYDADYFNKLKANLVPIFSTLTSGEIGELLNTKPTDISWQNVINKKKVIYFYLGSMIDQQVASNVGKMALQDLLYYLGTIYSFQEDNGRIPINIYVDEFYNVMFPGYVDLLNKSRGAGARVTIGMQTSKDIEAVTDEAKTGQILANTNHKICLRIPEPTIAELFQELFPKTTINDSMDTIGYNPDIADDGKTFGSSAGQRRIAKEMPLVDKSYITSLPVGHAFMYTQGEFPYKLRLPMIRDKIEGPFMKKVLDADYGGYA
jgi:hypothetical protein